MIKTRTVLSFALGAKHSWDDTTKQWITRCQFLLGFQPGWVTGHYQPSPNRPGASRFSRSTVRVSNHSELELSVNLLCSKQPPLLHSVDAVRSLLLPECLSLNLVSEQVSLSIVSIASRPFKLNQKCAPG